MELRHLRSFITATEQHGFTRAADVLNLTQGAVSQHVAALEKELDTELFERAGRTVKLTGSGHQLYQYARKIIDLVDEALDEVGRQAQPIRGTLRISASTVPAEILLPGLLTQFRSLHPGVHEQVTVSDSKAATRDVEAGASDVGLVGEFPASTQLEARVIGSDELVLVVQSSHPFATSKSISPKKLLSEPIVVREPGSGSRRCVERALESQEISPSELSIAVEVNTNEAIRAAVQRGVGMAFLSRSAVEQDVADGKLARVKVRGLQLRRELYLIFSASGAKPPALRAFLEFVRSQ